MHRTPFKNLVPPPPTLRLTEQRAALLVVDFQVFAADRSAGLGRLAAERGLEEELEEYYEQVGCARRNVRDLLTAFRARRLPVLYSRRRGADRDSPALGSDGRRYDGGRSCRSWRRSPARWW